MGNKLNDGTPLPSDWVADDGRAKALHEAVAALYFSDNSDYESALWQVVGALNPAVRKMLEDDAQEAFDYTSAMLAAAPSAPAEGGVSPGDAVFAFSAMLTSLPHVIPLGAAAWATPGADLAAAFNEANGLSVSRDFPEGLKFPEIEGKLLDVVKRASEEIKTAPEPLAQCDCSLRTRLVGDGCSVCNPELEARYTTAEPIAYGMRRKGETALIGLIPPKVHAIPPKVAEYLRDYEEVPLYASPQPAAEGSSREWSGRIDDAWRSVMTDNNLDPLDDNIWPITAALAFAQQAWKRGPLPKAPNPPQPSASVGERTWPIPELHGLSDAADYLARNADDEYAQRRFRERMEQARTAIARALTTAAGGGGEVGE